MVRNIVILGGSSHPKFVDSVCESLGVAPSARVLSKFSSGETRCEIQDSVRGKDVYIIQTFGVGDSSTHGSNKVNDFFIELCIMISACKTGSAKRVTAVLPLFPYSRQPDLPFSKVGAPLGLQMSRQGQGQGKREAASGGGVGGLDGSANEKPVVSGGAEYTFESVPATPGLGVPRTMGMSAGVDMVDAVMMNRGEGTGGGAGTGQVYQGSYTTHDYENPSLMMALHTQSGYKQWMAQSGSLVADLLTCAGADRVLTCDLHESTYQGFFDIPVDNLYARPLLKRYIQNHIPNYRDAVIVSPDAGGAKRASAIADSLGMPFALIHKERRPPKITDSQKATMMLVGNVSSRLAILVDDLADTANTITRAAKLLKRQGAVAVYALLTHGILSGDAVARINASALDRVVVTNTVSQEGHCAESDKLQVLDISGTFAEAVRRVHHGESISVLFQYD